MGNLFSDQSEERTQILNREMNDFLKSLKDGPDLTVDKNIVMFCSLESSENLKRYFEERKSQTYPTTDWTKELARALSGLVLDSKLAGLGALAVVVLIDIFSASSDGAEKALQKVFADQKTSEVWDLVDECLKRCRAYINDEDQLRRNIGRIEENLSVALTRLKNSMVREKQMSNWAVKVWVNGAAFHVQMMIHLVRLGGITWDPVIRYLNIYQKEVDEVFEEHRVMVESKCYCRSVLVDPEAISRPEYLMDDQSVCHVFHEGNPYTYLKPYYDHTYGRQKSAIMLYFREVQQNLHSLVHQKGRFSS